jgi:hypothetical protein
MKGDILAMPRDGSEPAGELLREWIGCLDAGSFVGLTLTGYRGNERELEQVTVRRIEIKGERCLQFKYRYRTRDIARNLSIEEGVRFVGDCLGLDYASARLQATTGDVRFEPDASGSFRLVRSGPSCRSVPSTSHDRPKRRLLDPGLSFLHELGLCDRNGKVLPSMSRKWKQINKFLEIFRHAVCESCLAGSTCVRVVDFGAGKGYLTFAVHDFLRTALGKEPIVTGVELRKDLVDFCESVARRLGLNGLSFQQGKGAGDIPAAMDVLIVLHACDTATDEALHAGIRSGAEIILCAPCCHKEIRPQLVPPDMLRPMLRFGIHAAQEAEMITDSLRALWLEWAGYRAQIIEFISLEHTEKNKMILAVRSSRPAQREEIIAQIAAIKTFYGIREHRLETLLCSRAEGAGL